MHQLTSLDAQFLHAESPTTVGHVGSLVLLDPATGVAVTAAALPRFLRGARLTRVGIEANAELCRGLLRERYAEADVTIRTPAAPPFGERRSPPVDHAGARAS